MNSEKTPWHALYVHSRAEKKVYERLVEMGFEAYLPLITKMKRWSDRMKKVEEPLFKSYLFVRSDEKRYFEVLSIPGVTRFVSFERKAVVVPENQIKAVMKYCDDFVEDDPQTDNQELHEGQLVMIKSGELMGLTGRLAPINNKKRLIVYIESVGRYIPVNISRAKVEPVHENMIEEKKNR